MTIQASTDQCIERADGETYACGELAFGSRTFSPGQSFAEHIHEHGEEILMVTSGVLQLKLPDGLMDLRPNQTVVVKRFTPHAVQNVSSSPAELLYFKMPFVDGDTVWTKAES